MIKILFTSDWHLGNYFHGYDRTSEYKHFLQWLLHTIQAEQPDALLVGGDVFDNSNPSAAMQELYFCFLDQVTQLYPGLQIVIIAGNHDSAARLEAPRAMLARNGIYVRGVIRRQVDGTIDYNDLIIPITSRINPDERAYVLAVPYLRDGDYERGKPYAAGVTGFLQTGIETLNCIRMEQEATILLGHLYARGSEIAENSSERIVVGGAEMIALNELTEEVNLLVLGHIHKRQRIGGSSSRRYVGSALPMSFTERNYQHGAEMACFETGKLMGEPRFIRYPLLRPLLSIPPKPASLEDIEKLIKELPDDFSGKSLNKLEEASDYFLKSSLVGATSKKDGHERFNESLDTLFTVDDKALWTQEFSASKPYLEVNVLLDSPNPGIVKSIEDMLLKYKKEVFLCRVHPTYIQQGTATEESLVIESTEDLLTRNPLDIIKKGYAKKHGCEMNETLLKLANQAIEAAKTETR
ncbi:MAG: exonuclease SbcCD subunit D [Phocaeicola sp.]